MTVRALPRKLVVRPLTPERWPDLEAVFNARGCSVARRCWCMYYRQSGSRGASTGWSMDARADYARLEAYPVDRPDRSGDDAMWFGAKSMYDRAGFEEVARRKPGRPIVRLEQMK